MVPTAAEADGDVGRAAAERNAATAQASQADLTQSVGARLTRKGHDAEVAAMAYGDVQQVAAAIGGT